MITYLFEFLTTRAAGRAKRRRRKEGKKEK
jgi:hypothetical protein